MEKFFCEFTWRLFLLWVDYLNALKMLDLVVYMYEYIHNTNCDSKEKKEVHIFSGFKIKQINFWISLSHLLFIPSWEKERKVAQVRLRVNK